MKNPTHDDLEMLSRDELIAEVRRLRQTGHILVYKGVRKQSKTTLCGLPLVSIATGPDPEKGEMRGHAKGIIAIGDIASGVLAIGGFAYGGIAIGGGAIGLIALGGGALSIFLAVGGFALGAVAIGGAAVGLVAIGGGALGIYVIDGVRQSPEAVQFFERFFPVFRNLMPWVK